MRRNLLLAQALAAPPLEATVLLITGAGEATAFGMPPNVDCLTLPALRKDAKGGYHPRNLNIAFRELIELRARTIRTSLEAFKPDVFIVDKVPRGVGRELTMTLEYLRMYGRTRCVLGLRDILDEPEAVRREWLRDANEEAIARYYDAVWIYGDPQVYDAVQEYAFPPQLARKVSYTGYLDQRLRHATESSNGDDLLARLDLPEGRLMLCMVGGGQDGARLAEAFSRAELPEDATGVILTGPYMPKAVQERLQRRAGRNPRLRVVSFVSDPSPLLNRAERVVAMGGYNTVGEILAFGRNALIVPRTTPRLEQWIRAERLSELGLVDTLHPDRLRPASISEYLFRDIEPRAQACEQVDMNGLSRLPGLLAELIDNRGYSTHTFIHGEGARYVAQ
jgi:predicted glycosyltransferase